MLLAAVSGLVLSLGVEALMAPRPQSVWKRPLGSTALHVGVWLAVFSGLVVLLGRPRFALGLETAGMLLLVLVNNAKMRALREPFVFQDYEYFTDAIRHPRLYIPFLGWGKAATAAAGFILAVVMGWWLEPAPDDRWAWSGQLGGAGALLLMAALLLTAGSLARMHVAFDPAWDVRELGLLASLWCYARAERVIPSLPSPFDFLPAPAGDGVLPHLVAVQSESFFDPRPLFAGIRGDILAGFDQLEEEALAHGKLNVPAWGANTVRSEFAFLSGIDDAVLGVHRFNPYRMIGRQGVPTLASYLKRLGYRTICVHPYPAGFYGRDRVYPLLGFDEFIDIRGFAGEERCGPYVGDAAVAQKVADILENATGPVFMFAITMENHGPLHLEPVIDEDVARLYTRPPPPGCGDLTVYLRHLRNADRMVAMLKGALTAIQRPASLCWFGDHVPIMPKVYEMLGSPGGCTEYVIWRNVGSFLVESRNLTAHHLAITWLQAIGLSGIGCRAAD